MTPEIPQPVPFPPIPSPSKLSHFLEYAKMHLHIEDAKEYQAVLEQHKLGPDILPFASEKLLLDIGIPVGDIIRLQRGSQVWWNGPDANRKRSDTDDTRNSDGPPPMKKSVFYKKKFSGGCGCTFSGPSIRPDDDANKIRA
jgi:hypothetical protein